MWGKNSSFLTGFLRGVAIGIFFFLAPTHLIAASVPQSMFDAVVSNDQEKVAELIRAGVDVSSTNDNGDTALILALFKEHLEIAEQLIKTRRALDATNSRRSSALHIAANKGYEVIVRMLIDNGASLSGINLQGNSALSLSIKSKHNAISELLIKEAANSNFHNFDTSTPYFLAVSSGNSNVVKLLLEHGVNPVQFNAEGYSALHLAIAQKHIEVARLILAYDKDHELLNYKGFSSNAVRTSIDTPLIHAASRGNGGAVDLLLRQPEIELDIVNARGDSALSIAIKHKRYAVAEKLLRAGASIVISDGDGSSLLYMLVFEKRWGLIQSILKRGANPNARIKEGSSEVLLHALSYANLETVERLLDAGAILNPHHESAGEALTLAIRMKKQSLKKKLLMMNVDLILQGRRGPPLLAAAIHRDHEVIEHFRKSSVSLQDGRADSLLCNALYKPYDTHSGLVLFNALLEKGANPDVICGDSPLLHITARHGYKEKLSLLIKHGANLNHRDRNGETALIIAVNRYRYKIAKQLVTSGADIYLKDNKEKSAWDYVLEKHKGRRHDRFTELFETSMKPSHATQ